MVISSPCDPNPIGTTILEKPEEWNGLPQHRSVANQIAVSRRRDTVSFSLLRRCRSPRCDVGRYFMPRTSELECPRCVRDYGRTARWRDVAAQERHTQGRILLPSADTLQRHGQDNQPVIRRRSDELAQGGQPLRVVRTAVIVSEPRGDALFNDSGMDVVLKFAQNASSRDDPACSGTCF